MYNKIKTIGVAGFFLIISIAMPCIGLKSYSYLDLIVQKNKILESSVTDVPPGEYIFKNASVMVMGTIPSAKPNILTEGVPFIKSFLMKLFIKGNIGKIFFKFIPFITILTKNTYTLTLELPKDVPSGDNNTFYFVNVFNISNPVEDIFNLSNQRHTLTVNYKYLGDETLSMFAIATVKFNMPMSFFYLSSYCESVTIKIPE